MPNEKWDRRPKPLDLPYNFTHRLTFSTSPPFRHPYKLFADLYPFRRPTNLLDSQPSDREPLPWILYIPSPSHGRNVYEEADGIFANRVYSNDSRRRLPQWLYLFAQLHGFPLVSIDHDLVQKELASSSQAPDPASTGSTLAATLRELIIEDYLNWAALSSGPGAEADTGAVNIDDNYSLFTSQGGMDPRKLIIVAASDAAQHAVECLRQLTQESFETGGAQGTRFDPVAVLLVDPENANGFEFQPRQSDGNQAPPFPPTLILAPEKNSSCASSLLDSIRSSSPEATALDNLLSPSSSPSQRLTGKESAAPTNTRYLLHTIASSEALGEFKSNGNGRSQSPQDAKNVANSNSAAMTSTLTLVEGFLLNWLGTAAEIQRSLQYQSREKKGKLDKVLAVVSKSRL